MWLVCSSQAVSTGVISSGHSVLGRPTGLTGFDLSLQAVLRSSLHSAGAIVQAQLGHSCCKPCQQLAAGHFVLGRPTGLTWFGLSLWAVLRSRLHCAGAALQEQSGWCFCCSTSQL